MENEEIWIINHYATDAIQQKNGRHYMFAKHLSARGYSVIVFCASTVHNTSHNYITDNEPFVVLDQEIPNVKFVLIKTRDYVGNGKTRILNMLDFYLGIMKTYRHFGCPKVVIGSSVHPLACYAALRVSKSSGCKNIIEIRDLWPLSLEDYGIISKGGLISRFMYSFEKRLYSKADAIVFTMEGGIEYVADQGWLTSEGGPVSDGKIFHINNGVDLDTFESNRDSFPYVNDNLDAISQPIVMYAGSVRRVNHVSTLVQAAALLRNDNIHFVVFGDGDELEELREEADVLNLSNITFFGRVERKYIPSILDRATILTALSDPCDQEGAVKYGNSNNKLFEYLASGKAVLINSSGMHSIVKQYKCGIEAALPTPVDYANAVKALMSDSNRLIQYGQNAREAALNYSFDKLTDDLVEVINFVEKEK